MADSQQAAARNQEIQEIEDELCFQNGLLQSIDDAVEDKDNAILEVKKEILALQKKLKRLRRGPNSLSSSQASASKATPSKKRNTKPQGVTESMNGYTNGEPSDGQAADSSTASTPNSANSLPEITTPSRLPATPSQMSLPSRKRTHSTLLGGGLAPNTYGDNKSRRTSPSPYNTSPGTPTSSSGDDEFPVFDANFFQRRQEAEEQRLRNEKLDEEFARSLQDDGFATINPRPTAGPSGINRNVQASSSSSMNSPSSSTQNAFNRMSGAHQSSNYSSMVSNNRENAHSASSRKLPAGWDNGSSSHASGSRSVKPEPMSMTPSIKAEGGYGSYQTQASGSSSSMNPFRPVKSENVNPAVKSEKKYAIPGTFEDDSPASDSEIEIIPPSAFHDNGRHQPNGQSGAQGQRPGYSSAASDAALRRSAQAATSSALQQAMYGKQRLPSWMQSQANPASSGSSMNVLGYPNAFGNPPQQPTLGMGMAMPSGIPGQYVYPNSTHTPAGNGVPKQESGLGYNGQLSDTFTDYLDGVDPRNSTGPYGLDGISGHELTGQMREQYDYIVQDPRRTNEEIKELLENIRPDSDLPKESREGTPAGLKYPLYEHQKLALTWLKSMETGTNKGGILADDMGLGKTLSALALILSRPSTDERRKTTLIVGPVALLRQWKREVDQKVNRTHRLSTHMVHGTNKKLTWDDLRTYDIVLTSYGTLGAEAKRLDVYMENEKKAGRRDVDQTLMKRLFPLLGPKSLFYRVILDEAQCIKNKNARCAKAACTLKSIYRLCLTGTPMMNNVGELYSLIHFLRIKPYNELQRFQVEFGGLTKDSRHFDKDRAIQKLRVVLKAILLRRTKQSKIDGAPIINLPPKTIEKQHVVFDDEEQDYYNALENKTQLQFNKYMKANTVGKNYSNILVLLLRLRQACCHPHLITDFEQAPVGENLTAEVMVELARTLQPDVVHRLLQADGFECPICYDGVPNPSVIIPCGHSTCSECLSTLSAAAAQQQIANGNVDGAQAKCPECRGILDPNKIIDYQTFQKVHDPTAVVATRDEEETESETDSDDDLFEGDSETEDDADSDGDLREFIVPDDIVDSDDEVEDDDKEADEGDDEAEVEPKPKSKAKKASKRRKDKKGKGKAKEKKPHLSLAMLKKESSRSSKHKKQYMKYLRKNWVSSAKVDKCMELLEQFQNEGEKTIVFSQFVSLLDLLQVPIDGKGWKMERYDGGMNGQERDDAVMRFTDRSECKMMLISLKAGNAGLNLVAASRVIILDPFWNPYIEYQAIDRAYRIGQQKPVQVHRILVQSTVEDRIMELQEKKEQLVNAALDEGANKSLGRLDVRQLAFLFGVEH